jgi:ABC-2 type transport system ATP-binding protein
MLTIEKLTKKYGDLTAVEDLSLEVPSGELFGFLGPNGAGKTTTIKMTCGLLKPTAGRVKVGGFDIQEQPIEAKGVIGLVPDTPVLYKKLTGREFLRFVGDLYAVPAAAIEKRVEHLLRLLDMTGSADDLIESYSHGMKQKTSIMAALIHDPEVVVLDEPTSGLDPRSARVVKDVLRALCKMGKTVFMSTHILEIAERVCDRVGIINGGKLVAVGSVSELRKKSKEGHASLEDIFLEVTGGPEEQEVIRFLET